MGLTVTTTSGSAAAAYRAGSELLLAAWPGAAAKFEAAIAADPDFALAHIARARIHQMYAEGAAARASAGRAAALAEAASERERDHVAVLAAAIAGDSQRATALAERHLELYPRDSIVLSLLLGAFGLYAFSGRLDHDQARVTICEQVARHYGQDWWFLGYHGWSLTEAGEAVSGRRLTEDALNLRIENANAAHAMAHAAYELGDFAGADDFLARWMPTYRPEGILHGHMAWHMALGALERGEADEAMAIYDRHIAPGVSSGPQLNVLTDSASLLWRAALQADASAAGDRWPAVSSYARQRFPNPGPVFGEVHFGVLASDRGPSPSPRQRLEEMAAAAKQGRHPAAPVGHTIIAGLIAFAAGDYEEARTALGQALPDLPRIGGSHAQRELVEDTLIVACLRSRAHADARTLLDHRLHRRPSARDQRWRTMAT
jgi:tetratricopeptide (TPR) repeat protein